jgi:hypothetical protein
VGSLILVPVLVVRIPADYFRPSRRPSESWTGRHPVQARALVAAKNLLGVLLVLAGIAMLVLPGQGILTILIGISITSFPGKRALERKVIGMPAVLKTINRLRARRGRPPLELPARGRAGSSWHWRSR